MKLASEKYVFPPPTLLELWGEAKYGHHYPFTLHYPAYDRCAYCKWRDDRWSDDPYDRLFKIYRWGKIWTVCRNHVDIYGPFPTNVLTGMTVLDVRSHPNTVAWWKSRMDHDGRYWGHVIGRLVRLFPSWFWCRIDHIIVDAHQSYLDWRKSKHENRT